MKSTAVIEKWIELFNAADLEGIIELYADGATNHPVFAEPSVGREAISALFGVYFSAGAPHCIVEELHTAGDGWVILEWKDAKGFRGVNAFHVVDGRIVMQRNYFDQLSFFRANGIPLPTE